VTAFYPLLSLASIALFAWLGRRMAMARNRNVLGWAVGGAFLPPVLLVLWRLRPLTPAEADDGGDLDEG
jgi:hypothetical protein